MAASSKKLEAVKELKAKLEGASAIIFVDYKGITVNEDTQLRREARKNDIDYFVAKNRLFQIALKELGVEVSFDTMLEGTTSFAVSKNDVVTPAKVVYEFSKKLKDKLAIKGGFVDGAKVDVNTVEALAKLPTRDELLGQIAYGLLSPVRMLAVAMSNVAEQKGE